VLIADARHGSLSDAESGSATIFLQDTRAQIFQQGQPAADILAPQITADQQAGTVLATGGVTVQARAKGENAVVTADRMLWNTRANTIIAVGNARLTRRPARGAPPITQTGGQITYDTARQEFVIAREEGAAP
jgi:lipopolysaccharide export system protein LptA